MSRTTGIEWTDATWSPLRVRVRLDAAEIARAKGYTSLIQIAEKTAGQPGQHCEHVSEGCKRCYSETWQGRCLKVNGTGLPFDRRSRDLIEPFVDQKILLEPLKWKTPKHIFVENQSDLFGEWFTDGQIAYAWDVIRDANWHTMQILTKRCARALDLLLRLAPLPHVHLGFSAEDQPTFDSRWGLMAALADKGWMVWCSYEPALGPLGISRAAGSGFGKLSWLVAGGESGPGARPAHPDWFRSARDQCVAAGVPFFFKQWGEFQHGSAQWGGPKDYVVLNDGRYCKEDDLPEFQAVNKDARDSWAHFRPEAMGRVGKKKAGALLDGREWKQFPEVSRS